MVLICYTLQYCLYFNEQFNDFNKSNLNVEAKLDKINN